MSETFVRVSVQTGLGGSFHSTPRLLLGHHRGEF